MPSFMADMNFLKLGSQTLPPKMTLALIPFRQQTNFPPSKDGGLPAVNRHPRGISLATALRATNFYLLSIWPQGSKPLTFHNQIFLHKVSTCQRHMTSRIKKCIYMTWGHEPALAQSFFTPPSSLFQFARSSVFPEPCNLLCSCPVPTTAKQCY